MMGAKNDALKAFYSSLLFSSPITVKNTPLIEDIFRTQELLEDIGVKVTKSSGRVFKLDAGTIKKSFLKKSLVESMRASILLVGPMLLRKKNVSFVHPGGCVIGKRPIDIFLDGWGKMGAKITLSRGIYRLHTALLHGCDFTFPIVSMTGTESLMMTAVLAKGRTILRNAALEPEIPHLAKFLNEGGATIYGAGTPTITIEGSAGRPLKGGIFTTMPDRIEAGSFAVFAATRGGKLTIKNCNPEHLSVLLKALEDCGAQIKTGKNWMIVSRLAKLRAIDILKTREYPGFPTDLQAPFVVLLTQAEGTSLVFETVFEGRLNYVEDLNRMGAHITTCDSHRVLINGPTPLFARRVESPDIRAGLAFVIAAAIADGESLIENVYQIDRGYERIDKRLKALGVDIRRENS